MARRHYSLGATVLALLCLTSGVTSEGSGSVRPIRFDDAPALAMFVDDPQILDAYEQTLEALDGATESVDIATSVIQERCADDDGCHFRILIRDPDNSDAPRVAHGLLTARGTKWRLGSTETTGDISDGMSGQIADVFHLSDFCVFQDHSSNQFQLIATAAVSSDLECVLRIDD